MLFADTVAMVIFWFTPLPIMSVMGGIRLTESEDVLLTTGLLVRFFGTASWPIWCIGGLICASKKRKKEDVPKEREPPLSTSGERCPAIGQGLRSLAAAAILIWIPIFPFTQPQQVNRRRAERDLYAGRIVEAIEFMSQRKRSDFPKYWDPPPRFAYRERVPAIDLVLCESEKSETADWVRDLFRQKLEGQANAYFHPGMEHALNLSDMDDERLAKYALTLSASSFGPSAARYHEAEISELLSGKPRESRRKSLEQLRDLIPPDKPKSEE